MERWIIGLLFSHVGVCLSTQQSLSSAFTLQPVETAISFPRRRGPDDWVCSRLLPSTTGLPRSLCNLSLGQCPSILCRGLGPGSSHHHHKGEFRLLYDFHLHHVLRTLRRCEGVSDTGQPLLFGSYLRTCRVCNTMLWSISSINSQGIKFLNKLLDTIVCYQCVIYCDMSHWNTATW